MNSKLRIVQDVSEHILKQFPRNFVLNFGLSEQISNLSFFAEIWMNFTNNFDFNKMGTYAELYDERRNTYLQHSNCFHFSLISIFLNLTFIFHPNPCILCWFLRPRLRGVTQKRMLTKTVPKGLHKAPPIFLNRVTRFHKCIQWLLINLAFLKAGRKYLQKPLQ